MGAIIQNDKPAGERKIFKCGASLIHKRVALTAGHCVHTYKPSELTAVFGEWDSKNSNESISRAVNYYKLSKNIKNNKQFFIFSSEYRNR